MKKALLFLLLIPALFLPCLTGCTAGASAKVKTSMDSAVKTLERLDEAAEEDLTAEKSVVGQRLRLRILFAAPTAEHTEEFDDILAIKAEIKQAQRALRHAAQTFSLTVKQIKSLLKDIKESGSPLTGDETDALDGMAEKIDETVQELRLTAGNVYLKLKKLRNRYDGGNTEEIRETHSAVMEALSARLDCAERLNEIAMEIKNLLFNRDTQPIKKVPYGTFLFIRFYSPPYFPARPFRVLWRHPH